MATVETTLYIDDVPWAPGMQTDISSSSRMCRMYTDQRGFELLFEITTEGRYFIRELTGEVILQGHFIISSEIQTLTFRITKDAPLYRLEYRVIRL